MPRKTNADRQQAEQESDPKPVLNRVGEQILATLESIAHSAQIALSEGPPGISRDSLVRPSNLMVGDAKPEKAIQAKSAEQRAALQKLLEEPLVARVDVSWDADGISTQTVYFPRRWTGGLGVPDAQFVSSLAALGQLAEYEAGETATIDVNGRTRVGRILKRVLLAPKRRGGQWDALVSDFGLVPWGDVFQLLKFGSLRDAIAAIARDLEGPGAVEDLVGQLMREAAEAASEHFRTKRWVVDRIALRDRPVLDRFQGQIFRLPIDRQVILFGPPGSGKTTTLIRRLAQKRTPEALTEHERSLVAAAGMLLDRPDSWAMYSPAELLKQYLGDAFNREGVPDAGNVRIWEKERHDLARNVFGILRSANNSGRFQLEIAPGVIADPSSNGFAKLHDEFATYSEVSLLQQCNGALEYLLKSTDEQVRRRALALQRELSNNKDIAIDDVLLLLDQPEGLLDEVRRIGDEINNDLNRTANLLLNMHRQLLDEIALALPTIRADEDEDEDDDSDDMTERTPVSPANVRLQAVTVLMSALRNWARAVAEGRRAIGGQSGRVLQLIGERLPTKAPFAAIGRNIALRARMRTLLRAPRAFVFGQPATYARFRREVQREGRLFGANEPTSTFLAGNKITPEEVDVLLLIMLRNARRHLQYDRRRLDPGGSPDWLEAIKNRYLAQVFVDEATDLSAVQLGCTVELTHPKLRSWFASGDLRQRITATGLRDESEIQWLNRTAAINIDVRRIEIGYRQSRRLRELSDVLANLLDPALRTKTEPSRGDEEADAWPLLRENLSGHMLAQWLSDRVCEVERAIGRLPSIAVFVDGDDKIDLLLAATKPLLSERNIPIAGYKGGIAVGDAREVRIFDVQHIKGMEFEAVFFVGVDRLAERIPDLFLRIVYVGVTRAATYLGLTCEAGMPKQLAPVRSYFSTENWMGA